MEEGDYQFCKHNEWVRPIKKGFGFACCDCGLVHSMDFKHIKWGKGRKILFRIRRNEEETEQLREHMRKRQGG